MNSNDAFRPAGQTVAVSAPTTSPPSGVTGNNTATVQSGGDMALLVYNPGPNDVWMGYGSSATAAQNNAVVPTPGTPQTAMAIPHGTIQSFKFTWNTFFSFLAVTGAQTIYFTPGDGI